MTEYLEREVLRELEKEYGSVLSGQHRRLAAALREIYVETDRQFVFLIDEWDCVMRDWRALLGNSSVLYHKRLLKNRFKY